MRPVAEVGSGQHQKRDQDDGECVELVGEVVGVVLGEAGRLRAQPAEKEEPEDGDAHHEQAQRPPVTHVVAAARHAGRHAASAHRPAAMSDEQGDPDRGSEPASLARSRSLTTPHAKKPKTMTRMNQRVWNAPDRRNVHAVTDSRLETTTTATGTVTSSPPTVPAFRLGEGALRSAISTAATMSHRHGGAHDQAEPSVHGARRITRAPAARAARFHGDCELCPPWSMSASPVIAAAPLLTAADHIAPGAPRSSRLARPKAVVQSAPRSGRRLALRRRRRHPHRTEEDRMTGRLLPAHDCAGGDGCTAVLVWQRSRLEPGCDHGGGPRPLLGGQLEEHRASVAESPSPARASR